MAAISLCQRLTLLAALAVHAAPTQFPSPREPGSGIRYEFRRTDIPQEIHILEVVPEKVRIVAARALNEGIGRETVSSIARRTSAHAAVNGGFFRIGGRYDGEPEGVLKVGGRWFSDASLPRGALGWTGDTSRVLFGRITAGCSLRAGSTVRPVDGLNRPRTDSEAILYSWDFHRSTLTDPGGTEIQIHNGRVLSILRQGDTPILPGGFVLSLGPASTFPMPDLKIRRRVSVECTASESARGATEAQTPWAETDFIVGGVPLLIRRGEKLSDFGPEKAREGFLTDRHPRTAVGLRADGTWLLVVVDGRQAGKSLGMTIAELAGLMESLGCVDALNLDGGGSSTMYLEGRTVNSPSDGQERPVSDAILFYRHQGASAENSPGR